MEYSADLRERVLAFIDAVHSKAMAFSFFKVSRQAIDDWINLRKQTGGLKDLPRIRGPRKLEDLESYVRDHPDAFLYEIGEKFGLTAPGVHFALKKLGLMRNKKRFSTKSEPNH